MTQQRSKKPSAALSIILTLIMLFSITVSSVAITVDNDLVNNATSIYSQALSMSGRDSFHGACNLATAYSLKAVGVYSGGLDYSGSGNSWYDYFSDLSGKKTSGGYTITTVAGSDCLNKIADTYGDVENVVVSYGTGGTSGANHVLYISAVKSGLVYYTDSFSYYGLHSEGGGCAQTIDDFNSIYCGMNGYPYGAVIFSKETLKKADSSDSDDMDVSYTSGSYLTNAQSGLRIRTSPSGDKTGVVIPFGAKVTVNEVKDGWGKVNYQGTSGWISLEYATLIETETEDSTEAQEITTKVYTFIVGDMNGDGKVTAIDARLALRKSAKLENMSDSDLVVGDVDGDGKLTAKDSRLILRISGRLR